MVTTVDDRQLAGCPTPEGSHASHDEQIVAAMADAPVDSGNGAAPDRGRSGGDDALL
jgi:hypothetical protein